MLHRQNFLAGLGAKALLFGLAIATLAAALLTRPDQKLRLGEILENLC